MSTIVSAGLAAGVLVLAFGVPIVVFLVFRPPPTWLLDAWGLLSIVDHAAAIGGYLAVVALVVALADIDGRTDGDVPGPLVRQAGIVFVVLTFYWTSEQVFYVPISLLLGLLLAYAFTLPRNPPPSAFAETARQLAQRLTAEHAAIKRRQQDLRPPEAGTDYAAYAAEQRALDEELRRIRLTRSAGTGQGPVPVGGWAHGLWAAAMGTLIGAPWIVLQLSRMMVWPSDELFVAFGLVTGTGWLILQWPIYGFFLGYFYPHIRGGSGLPKALTLFVAVVVPPLVFQAVVDHPVRWSGYLVWAVQMLVFVLLLGLVAGDGWVLARAGLRWPHLFDVHRKRYLLAAATVVLAQAGLLTAMVTGLLPVLLTQLGVTGPGTDGAGPR